MEFSEKDSAALMSGSIPGESLTSDPEAPQEYETAPSYNNLEDFVDDLFMNITKPDSIDGIIDSLRQKVPVEDVAQLLLFKAMSSGKINTDLMLLAVEPTIYMLVGLGEFSGVEDLVLYPEDDMIEDEEDEVSALEEAAGSKPVKLKDLPAPQGVSKSLIGKMTGGPDDS